MVIRSVGKPHCFGGDGPLRGAAIDGIINEANEVAGGIADKKVLGAEFVAAGRAVGHYEIARYGTLIAWSKLLGCVALASIVEQTLAGEKGADEKPRAQRGPHQQTRCAVQTA